MTRISQPSIPFEGSGRIGPRAKLLFLAMLLTASYVSYAQTKDTLYFYNKTKVVGKLLGITLGRIEFDAIGIGIVKIKNSNVESMNATSRGFRVQTLEGKEHQGYIMRSDKPGSIVVHSIIESKEIKMDSISSLVFYGRNLRNRFTGNVSAGFTYTKSSKLGRLNSDGNIFYNTAKSQTQLKGDMILTWDSVSTYVERANVALAHDYTIAPLWSALVILKYQRNIELGLGRRWQQAFGVGREFHLDTRQVATISSAIAFNQENNLENVQTTGRELMLQANYNMFSFLNPNLIVSFVESAFVSITSQERFRLDGNISLEYELITDFYISLQMYHNFDSRSPATGQPNTDYGFVAGLRYKF